MIKGWFMLSIVIFFTQGATAFALQEAAGPSTDVTLSKSDPVIDEPIPLPGPIVEQPPVPDPRPLPPVSIEKPTGKEKAMLKQDEKGTKELPNGMVKERRDGRPGFQIIRPGYPPTEGSQKSGKK